MEPLAEARGARAGVRPSAGCSALEVQGRAIRDKKGFCRKHRDEPLINNRQAGRRRGRNNPRQQGGGNRGNGDSGNRIDSRARGNAAQLLEKYRNMARDAQMAGDRVNAEYYLQFADHYFRVLADNRARQEEQQARFRRNDEPEADSFEIGDEGEESGLEEGDESTADQNGAEAVSANQERPSRRRNEGGEPARPPRERRERSDRKDERAERRPRGANANDDSEGNEGLNLAALPPAIGRSETNAPVEVAGSEEEEPAAPKPRRGRRPRQAEAAE